MYKIELTKEEKDAILIQIGARLDDLKTLQIEAGKRGNVNRVIEIEEFMKPIRSAYDKIFKVNL